MGFRSTGAMHQLRRWVSIVNREGDGCKLRGGERHLRTRVRVRPLPRRRDVAHAVRGQERRGKLLVSDALSSCLHSHPSLVSHKSHMFLLSSATTPTRTTTTRRKGRLTSRPITSTQVGSCASPVCAAAAAAALRIQ